jgi:hypothetical protein
VPVWGNLYESESRLTAEAGRATYHRWMEDVERLDEMIKKIYLKMVDQLIDHLNSHEADEPIG